MRSWNAFPRAEFATALALCALLAAPSVPRAQNAQLPPVAQLAPDAPDAPDAQPAQPAQDAQDAQQASAAQAAPAGQSAPGAPAVSAPAGRPRDAAELLARFATMGGLEAAYEEEKHLALLAAPLKSRGRLYFMRPGYLARFVEAPEESTLRISPTELQLSGRDGDERIDLRQSDNVRLFITSLVQVFLGDEAALKASFEVSFELSPDDATGWTLTLVPRGAPLDKLMAQLSLHGEGVPVTRIEVREPNGDRTLTHILQADVARTFSDEEKLRLFGWKAP